MPLIPSPDSTVDVIRPPDRRGSLMRSVQAPAGAMVTSIGVELASDGRPRNDGGTALTAAAQVMFSPQTRLARKRIPLPQQSWQKEVWGLYRECGELRFSGDRLARAASRGRLFIGKRPKPDQEVQPADDAALVELSKSMFGDAAANAQALFRAAQHLAFNGDTIILVADKTQHPGATAGVGDPTTVGHTWSTHSTTEVTGLDGVSRPKLNDGVTNRDITDDELAIRCWSPDPEYMSWASCPTRAILPVARELVQLTKYVSAQIDSRLAGAGLLILPAGIQPMGEQIQREPQYDPDTGIEITQPTLTFGDQLAEAMTVPVYDRSSAASLVPFLAEVDEKFLGKAQYIRFDTPLDPKAHELRDEAIRRIALGMDSDPSVLLGMDKANHWTGWLVSEDEVKLSVAPLLATVCHALNTGWLQPVLAAMGVPDASDYTVWYDLSELELRPDRSKDAQALYDMGELSASALRRESGFSDLDKPSDEEKRDRIVERIAVGAPTLAAPMLKILGIEIPVDALVQAAETAQATDAGTASKVADAPPGTTPGKAPAEQPGRSAPDTLDDNPTPADDEGQS